MFYIVCRRERNKAEPHSVELHCIMSWKNDKYANNWAFNNRDGSELFLLLKTVIVSKYIKKWNSNLPELGITEAQKSSERVSEFKMQLRHTNLLTDECFWHTDRYLKFDGNKYQFICWECSSPLSLCRKIQEEQSQLITQRKTDSSGSCDLILPFNLIKECLLNVAFLLWIKCRPAFRT